jgi:DNA-binding NtrC family response regulator
MYPLSPVLIVDDEANFLLSVELTLTSGGINNIRICNDSRGVMKKLEKETTSLIMLDLNLPFISGMELLPDIVAKYPQIPVVVVTASNEVENAVECMKSGAFDYIVKPVDDTRLITTIRRGLDLREIRNENVRLKEYLLEDKLEKPEVFENIITQSPVMRSIFKYIEAIANTPLPVLITGETGVGKELVAKSIHDASGRKGEIVVVNVAGVDDHLFSDTLFGHKKGAFTGAENDRNGMVHLAENGTLFLDEIGDLSIESQVKLLRLLQERSYYPLGSDLAKLTNARVIVATNRNLESMIEKGNFRQDLFYRLNTHHVHIPSLKERKQDIPLLVNRFLEKAASTLNKKKPTPPKELFTLLSTYHFPGNIRELEGLILDAVSLHKSGVLSIDMFRQKLYGEGLLNHFGPKGTKSHMDLVTFKDELPTIKEAEEELINEALKRADGNQTIAAQLLGISRNALNNRLRRSLDHKQNKQ